MKQRPENQEKARRDTSNDQEAKDHMEQITQNLEKLTSGYQVVKNLFLKFSQISQEAPVLESLFNNVAGPKTSSGRFF